MFLQLIKFFIYSFLIVVISKYILVKVLRNLAEALNLKPKTVGNITGIATSVPELLMVTFASVVGLGGVSIYNILSSNIINFVLYMVSIFVNKNQKVLNNTALKMDLTLVLLTIFVPLFLIWIHFELNMYVVPIFVLLFILFYFINNNSHKLYLSDKEKIIEKRIEKSKSKINKKIEIVIKYSLYLLTVSVFLYLIGDRLNNVLQELAIKFNISQVILGIALGIISSLPEFITFFEFQKYHNNQERELGVIETTNNLLTSNIFNLFFIETLSILVYNLIY